MDDSVADPSGLIATYIATLSADEVSPGALSLCERSVIDTIGVTLAGLDEDPAKLTAELVRLHGGRGPCTIYGSDMKASRMDAALVHGTAAHSLDFDDTSAGINGHPSATMIPALLSVAEKGRITGLDVLTAYVAGFETQCLIAAPILESHYSAGWHTTATLGTFGVAAATAKLLDLDASEIRHSLNIAASMSAGLKKNFGSMTKSLHAGHAARSGLTASLLAREGFTAGSSAIGDDGGFLDLYGNTEEVDSNEYYPTEDRWFIEEKGIHLKKYPCCHYAHAAIEETIGLVVENDIHPDEIDHISVEVSPGAMDAASIERPETGLEGKFSMHFLVACAAVFREVRLDTFVEEKLFDQQLRALMERISVGVNENRSYGSLSADVGIETRGGHRYFVENARAPGLYGINPLSYEELREKFLMCSSPVLGERSAEQLWELLNEFRTLEDLSPVQETLS